jgi:radical SAM superfamily enzyme YgiQ (UPF0313 family)
MSDRLGVTGFYFVDDCFLDRPPKRADRLCELLIERGSPYRIGCDVQIDDLENTELLGRMYKAGFRCFYVGIEAASEAVRRRLGKARISDNLARITERVLDMGYLIRASIGIGWPSETESEMEQTLELIDQMPNLLFDAFRYLPLPGVPLTTYWSRQPYAVRDDLISQMPFEDYSEYNANYSSIPADRFEYFWAEMIKRRDERYRRYFGEVENSDSSHSVGGAT